MSKIKEVPDITLREMIEEFKLPLFKSPLSKRLKKLGYTYKEKTLHPIAQQRKAIVIVRASWQDNQCKNIETSRTCWIGESSVNCGMTRPYGRFLSNEMVNDYGPEVRFERTSIIGALGTSGIVAPFTFTGTFRSEVFAKYVAEELTSILKRGDNFILDNSSVHKTKDIMKPLVDLGVNIIFLPAYSSDFNPIEMAWSKMKSLLRKAKPRTTRTLFAAIKDSLNFITSDDAKSWISHCGYRLPLKNRF